jgi:hypothetical protein
MLTHCPASLDGIQPCGVTMRISIIAHKTIPNERREVWVRFMPGATKPKN